jgi:acetyl/propionyl-CoA carboxylase alpha subunit/acetyl-CoA carboxylase carboxyltransferase component
MTVLVANRGEIAVRIIRAARGLGMKAVAVYSEDDAGALHTRCADDARALPGRGAAAYLDIAAVVAGAVDAGCTLVHPGYGFLSENAAFAGACGDAGIGFVGPRAETLEALGDKTAARRLAAACGVPVPAGTTGPTTIQEAVAFFRSRPAGCSMMLKAIAGGGGRGMRLVHRHDEIEEAFARCTSEARNAFGNGDLYVEEAIEQARHVEVQVLGDGTGAVSHLWERECSLQRRHQKVVEVAPCPNLDAVVAEAVRIAAVRMAEELAYLGAGTFEFLVGADGSFAFLEANPRLQVEHTVTEEVTGVDLVQAQLRIAAGATLADIGLVQADVPPPAGFAVQLRINAETMGADGSPRASSGTVTTLDVPTGDGIRFDGGIAAGDTVSSRYDPLLGKLVVHSPSPDFADAVGAAAEVVARLRIEGVDTNLGFLRLLLGHPDVAAARVHTRFVEDHATELLVPALPAPAPASPAPTPPIDGTPAIAPVLGTVVAVEASPGDAVAAGSTLLVIEAMKMEHPVVAPVSGVVRRLLVGEGETVDADQVVAVVEEADVAVEAAAAAEAVDLDMPRPDLAEALARHAALQDDARPDAVARRRAAGRRTARENIADLCDPGSFTEYGSLVVAAQRQRHTEEELRQRSPADGLITGVAEVNGERCLVMSYDYTVMAGTQGMRGHKKADRMFDLAERWRLPVVVFTEGGGGRPGDTDFPMVAGLDISTFWYFGRLSGLVPLVGVNSGRCFAGNAVLLGCCDVVIATQGSNIGMGGPAMIEGGGLGTFRPEEIGPTEAHAVNGVADIVVEDEAEAVVAAKHYLSFFQGPVADWDCADQRVLRTLIPENRLRIYDVRRVIDTLADTGSVLELRRTWGTAMVTALARVEGRPLGIVANNPDHLGGAIDGPGADKAARFLQLCDTFDIPVLFLCDTPGMMVGPEVEKTGLVRHAARLFVTGANLRVPSLTIVLRKAYGLGAQAMAGGSFRAPFFSVAWPTGEFGGMGLEGSVKLGFRKELEAVEDPAARQALFDRMVAEAYETGKALNAAAHFEIDDVIDPAESRTWISKALRSVPPPEPRTHKRWAALDTW